MCIEASHSFSSPRGSRRQEAATQSNGFAHGEEEGSELTIRARSTLRYFPGIEATALGCFVVAVAFSRRGFRKRSVNLLLVTGAATFPQPRVPRT